MDVTDLFLHFVQLKNPDKNLIKTQSNHQVSSLIAIKASDTFHRLLTHDDNISALFNSYVGYYDHINGTTLTSKERKKVLDEVTLTSTDLMSDITELKCVLNMHKHQQASHSNYRHLHEILLFLLDKWQEVNKKLSAMQNECIRMNRNPFKLLTNKYYSGSADTTSIASSATPSSTPSSTLSSSAVSKSINDQDDHKVTTTFASAAAASKVKVMNIDAKVLSKYVDEIAPRSKVKQYEEFSLQHQALLKREAISLHRQFGDEMQEAMKAEATVASISNLMNDFAAILQAQGSQVEELLLDSKVTTESVKYADSQLLLTLERSASQQRNMTFLIVGMAFLLLLLDFLQ